MVKDALKWIDAVGTLWKILAGVVLASIFIASCGAGYATLRHESSDQGKRIDNLESNDRLILDKIVTGLKDLDDAQQHAFESECKATAEYRKEQREQWSEMEKTVVEIKTTVQHIKETMRGNST
jgi:hypothetical protein